MNNTAHSRIPRDPGIPLAMVRPGCRVRLVAVHGGRGLIGRLSAMGLVPGVEIEVLNTNGAGPMVVKVMGSRLMLGRGLAQKVLVN